MFMAESHPVLGTWMPHALQVLSCCQCRNGQAAASYCCRQALLLPRCCKIKQSALAFHPVRNSFSILPGRKKHSTQDGEC